MSRIFYLFLNKIKAFFMLRCITVGLLFLIASVEAQTPADRIGQLIQRLSADSMDGRGNFNGGLYRAVDVVERELRSIGVRPVEAKNGYRQAFTIYQVSAPNIRIVLNDRDIALSDAIVQSSAEHVNITQPIESILIDEGDNLFAHFGEILKRNTPVVALIHPVHERAFRSAKKYLDSKSHHLFLDGKVARFFLLTGEKSIRSLSITSANRVEKIELVNLMGMIPGKRAAEKIILSAHLDHIGVIKPVNGDSIANGADDNASGVSAVLTLAKHLAATQPERTVMVVFFAGEELGLLGSEFMASQVDADEIVAMVNLEMLGKPSSFGRGHAFMTGYNRSTLGKILNDAVGETRIHPDPYPEQNLFLRSDNASFARLGVPAHTISVTPIDVDSTYHTVHDEIARLDLDNLARVVDMLQKAIMPLIDGSQAPSRVIWDE
jgi:hypothetical protein